MNQLNEYIFRDIIIYLLKNQKFNYILELSLSSKSTFKLIRNLIINQNEKDEFIEPISFSLEGFWDYLSRSVFCNYEKDEDPNEIYGRKLIAYKDIRILFIKVKIWRYGEDSYFSLKDPLNEFCKQLEKVVFLKSQYSYSSSFPVDKDYFQYNKLSLLWDRETDKPSSSDHEDNYHINNFNFQFLNWYNPNKISISMINNEKKLIINDFNNIFINGGKRLESIEFKNHKTPYNFLKQSLNSKLSSVRSLKLRFSFESFYFQKDEQQENEERGEEEVEEEYENIGLNISKLLEYSFKISMISKNESIEKLLLRKCLNISNGNSSTFSTTNNRPSLIIKQLQSNSSLRILGLEIFDINNSIELNDLNNLKNIKSLYCDIQSIQYFLQHCQDNSNIASLVISNEFDKLIIDQYYNFISNFFKSNNTLESIKFNYYKKNKNNFNKNKLLQLLKESNNKKIILIYE